MSNTPSQYAIISDTFGSFVRFSDRYTYCQVAQVTKNIIRVKLFNIDDYHSQTIDINTRRKTMRVRSGANYTSAYGELCAKIFNVPRYQVRYAQRVGINAKIIGYTYSI